MWGKTKDYFKITYKRSIKNSDGRGIPPFFSEMNISFILEDLAACTSGIVAWFKDADSLASVQSSRVPWNVT